MRKCHAVGSRKLQASGAKTGSAIKSAFLGLITRKYAPEKLKLVLKVAADVPIESVICHKVGMSKSALRYALKGSREGRPGDIFDIKLENGGTERFHILFEDAIEAATDKIEEMAFEMATGTFRKILEYQGKVTYKKDRKLVAQGLPEEETYLLDENGERIPETIPFFDPEMARWILEKRRPEIYGKRPKEPRQTGGVLVVGNPMTTEEFEKCFGGPQPIVEVEFEGLPPPDSN
jgi:hypothetical protein